MTQTKLPISPCFSCGQPNDAATGVFGANTPKPGDLTVCMYCGYVMAFDAQMRTRKLTGMEMINVAGDTRIWRLQVVRATTMKGKKP